MQHIAIMLQEIIVALNLQDQGIYIDATFGRGGHSTAMLAELAKDAKLLVIDKDPEAIACANKLAANDPRVVIQQGSFSKLQQYCEELNITGKVNGILADLGVSSPQLDDPTRGFSFLKDGPLDMRMDPSCGISASEWINSANAVEIANVLQEYADEKFASRIARAIVQAVKLEPIVTTRKLAAIISDAVPIVERNKHPATRSFQAIRIFINAELTDLETLLAAAKQVLAPGGKLVLLSFHSLEHRIIKNFIRDNREYFKKSGSKQKASRQETIDNRRARSAFLRVLERTDHET